MVINNNLFLQFGRVYTEESTTQTFNKTLTLPITFNQVFHAQATGIEVGDVVTVKQLRRYNLSYWIGDRLTGVTAMNQFYWLVIGI